MEAPVKLVLLAGLAFCVAIADAAPPPSPAAAVGSVSVNLSSSDSTPYVASPYDVTSKFNPSMAIIVVVLLSAFFFMGFFSVYVRRCTTDDDFANFPFADDPPPPFGAFGSATRRSDRPPQGLDPSLLTRLPVLKFSALKAPPHDSECSVCLSSFQEDEALRLLPNCGHSFHQDCIDMWLFSHTTCPLCRRSLLLLDKNGSVTSLPIAAAEQNPAEVGNALVPAPAAHIAIDIQDSSTALVAADQQGTPASESPAADLSPAARQERVSQCGSPILGVMEPPSGSKKQNRSCKGRELRRSHSTGHSLVKGARDRMNRLISSPSSDTGDPSSCSPLIFALASNFHRSQSYTMLSNMQSVQQAEEQQADMDVWAYHPMRWLKKELAAEVGDEFSSCSEPSSSKATKSSPPTTTSSSVRRKIKRLAGMDRIPQFFLSEHHSDFAQLAYVL